MEYRKVTREDLRELARGRVFTTEELAETFHRSLPQAAKMAFDLRKRGLLTKVQRGVYASVPLEADPRSFHPDPFLTSRRVLGKAYAFSHQSALVLHGAEQTVRKTVHVSAPRVRSRRRVVGGFVVHVHRVSPDTWRESTTTVRRGGIPLRVTTAERTLVDLAALPNSKQDYEEDLLAFRTLIPKTDSRRLLREVLNAPSRATRARVGHLLQANGSEMPSDSEILKKIEEAALGAGPTYFATTPRVRTNRFDRRFKLVYPGVS
ncbi:MAG: type IV toxin-antitoxin system AbiEi family antitoxin domain-containing protein [Thermoplasmata archaeon]